MATELTMLGWSAALCVVQAISYTIGQMGTMGLPTLAGNREDVPAPSGWIGRARRAHANMVENLVVFAALVLAVVAAGKTSGMTATAAELFLAARVVYTVVYIAGIPWLRTLVFAVGVIAQAMLFLALVA
jgi:uncharacterized MAPEG superfamily protein